MVNKAKSSSFSANTAKAPVKRDRTQFFILQEQLRNIRKETMLIDAMIYKHQNEISSISSLS